MCTGFIKKGKDLICGFNLDLAENVWDYRVYAKKDMFYIGIKVGSTIYKTHGVNAMGNFGNLPYMNAPDKGVFQRGKAYQRLDLVVNDYIGGRLSYDEVLEITKTKSLVNVPNCSMHALLCDRSGRMLLLEPGLGAKTLAGEFAVIANFPLLETVEDLSAVWYGKDRYDKAVSMLEGSGDDFSVADGLALLEKTRQTGEWATRVSFVYSLNENAVYYAQEDDFSKVVRLVF